MKFGTLNVIGRRDLWLSSASISPTCREAEVDNVDDDDDDHHHHHHLIRQFLAEQTANFLVAWIDSSVFPYWPFLRTQK